MNIGIDFIAHHALQAQSAQSVFAALQDRYRCRWRLGANQAADGEASVAILLDHRPFHPRLAKAANGYRHLFHMSHDLGDTDVYASEWMDDFDLLLVPGPVHREAAIAALGRRERIVEIGWPKFDPTPMAAEQAALLERLRALPGPRILYAPTWPNTWEWRELLPWLDSLPCTLLVKNHILVDPGQPFPLGEEARYAECRRSIDAMEAYLQHLAKPTRLVAPPAMNLCALFPHIDLLITDSSSCAMEFAPFGSSVETGRTGAGDDPVCDFDPQGSSLCAAVQCLGFEQLQARLPDGDALITFVAAGRRGAAEAAAPLIAVGERGRIGAGTAAVIDAWLRAFPDGASLFSGRPPRRSLRRALRRLWSR